MKEGPGGLPRQIRLRSAKQFTGSFSRRLQGHWYQIFARSNQLATARLGLIAGRRAAARAVDRSLAKRLAREEFRRIRQEIPGLDVIVRLRTPVARGERIAARTELRELLARLGA